MLSFMSMQQIQVPARTMLEPGITKTKKISFARNNYAFRVQEGVEVGNI